MPQVSLVAILDADKEGFLRSHRSLTQTVGRAARNLNGKVIMYADKITDSMQLTIDETNRRRSIQMKYNEENGITPQAIVKARNRIIGVDSNDEREKSQVRPRDSKNFRYLREFAVEADIAADPVFNYMNGDELKRTIENCRTRMVEAAKNMEFIEAARLRDEIIKLEKKLQAIG